MSDKYNQKIHANKNMYTIFVRNGCGYSTAAINLLKTKNLPFKSYIITNKEKFLNNLIANSDNTSFNTSHNTYPVIFYDSKFIGGYDSLENYLNQF